MVAGRMTRSRIVNSDGNIAKEECRRWVRYRVYCRREPGVPPAGVPKTALWNAEMTQGPRLHPARHFH